MHITSNICLKHWHIDIIVKIHFFNDQLGNSLKLSVISHYDKHIQGIYQSKWVAEKKKKISQVMFNMIQTFFVY